MSIHKAFALTLAIAAVALGGCGDKGPERAIVSGVVTYRGEPIAQGTILFTPTADSQVPSARAAIRDGKYRVDNRGGVPVGTHRVAIEAYRRVPFTPKPGEPLPRNYSGGKVSQQYLPRHCNARSKLEIIVEPGIREIAKDFDLTD